MRTDTFTGDRQEEGGNSLILNNTISNAKTHRESVQESENINQDVNDKNIDLIES
uniref:Uncharacterized protein n=1 Tax=Anguilla anguilla TaxID=7936 RepID=A0A0E9UVN5_ANGAN